MKRIKYWIRTQLRKLGFICYCGSGAHPRRCKKHPWGYRMHCMDMNHDNLSDFVDELEERIEVLEKRFNDQ